jgi:putative membrane-bound dehydrogenase-like protein
VGKGEIVRARAAVVASLAVVLAGSVPLPAQLAPEEAVRRMRLPEGFRVQLVAAEPVIRQPVTMTFDDRGRLWLIQYLQYPNPEGLKPVKVDQFLRTVYDRVPEPPPRGPRGQDRITILEDPDETGRFRKARDFVTGLNLATGLALGHDGVFVVQPPYLLFYPDRNHDDVPDGDPEVLLSGFGMEDSHAFANSLVWGPDGWLYGAQGSTVTARLRGIEFQQGIWRYQPRTRQFELFAEGGGNTWGLDFDRHGRIFASTNFGGRAMLHQVQGGYYIKNFGKHGALHNPHAYGYFDHVPHENFKGGHVTIGGVFYHGGAFPPDFDGAFLAANVLSNAIYWHHLRPHGSSFTARLAGDLLWTDDVWFRPIDCLVGPDGALYVADWYDKRANHVDPIDNWDKSDGRIYRIEYRRTDAPAAPLPHAAVGPPLSQRASDELVDLLTHRNQWYVREARRILAERRDPAVHGRLRRIVFENPGQLALEALWALYVSGGLGNDLAVKLTEHPNEHVRAWIVRLAGDGRDLSPELAARLVHLAQSDPSPTVRSQLACTARRLAAADALSISAALMLRAEDANDPHIPLLVWWAIEDKAVSHREQVLKLLEPPAWQAPLVRKFLIERLGRRYLAEGTEAGYATCARLLAMAPGPDELQLLLAGMEQALEGRKLEQVPPALAKPLADLWQKLPANLTLVRFALRLGSADALDRAIDLADSPKTPLADRVALVDVLGQTGSDRSLSLLLKLLDEREPAKLRLAVLTALSGFSEPRVAECVLAHYPKMPADLRGRAQTLLCSRPASTLAFLQAVDRGAIPPREVPLDLLRRVTLYQNEAINQLVHKHWGRVAGETSGEKQSRIRSIMHINRMGTGDAARGKLLALCRLPPALRRGDQARSRPDRRRAQEPRATADQHRRSQRRHPAGVRRPRRRHYRWPRPHRPDCGVVRQRHHPGQREEREAGNRPQQDRGPQPGAAIADAGTNPRPLQRPGAARPDPLPARRGERRPLKCPLEPPRAGRGNNSRLPACLLRPLRAWTLRGGCIPRGCLGINSAADTCPPCPWSR